MAVGFGFSVGDLIAVGKLIHDIVQALNDCRGAAAEYKSLIVLLTSLRSSITVISGFVSTLSLAASRIDHAFMNGILFHGQCCQKILNQFMTDSRKYTESLLNGQGHRGRAALRKIKWSLYNSDDARKLEQRLSTHLEAFDRYLVAINIQVSTQSAERLEEQVLELSTSLSVISVTVGTVSIRSSRLRGKCTCLLGSACYNRMSCDIRHVVTISTTLKRDSNLLPGTLGYTWETDISSSHVHLSDVLGRCVVLPALLCRSFESFHDTLRIMFSDLPGFYVVMSGKFEIRNESNNSTVYRGPLSSHTGQYLHSTGILPGAKLLMSALHVRSIRAPEKNLVPSVLIREACPGCGFLSSGKRSRKCTNCDLNYRMTITESSGTMPKLGDEWLELDIPRSPVASAGNVARSEPFWANQIPSSDEVRTTPGEGSINRLFKRTHYVTEYIVPVQSGANYYGNSGLPLFQAIGQGNLHWVRHLLTHSDTDPNLRDFQGWTALQQACYAESGVTDNRDQIAIVEFLIAHGANVNAELGDGYACTALQAACERGNKALAVLLISLDAEINAAAAPFGGRSALASASEQGDIGLVQMLLDSGADVNQVDESLGFPARTALAAAAKRGHMEIIALLIQHGADIQRHVGWLAFQDAISFDQADVISRFFSLHMDVNQKNGGVALIHSVRSACILNLLLAHGAVLEPEDLQILIHIAVCPHSDFFPRMIQLGANVNDSRSTDTHHTVLQTAAGWVSYSDGPEMMVRQLVEQHGMEVNEPWFSEQDWTALEAACHSYAYGVRNGAVLAAVKFLLDRGAEITPFTLHVAVAFGREDLGELLLSKGARVQILHESTRVVIRPRSWGDDPDFGSTVMETAEINGRYGLADKLRRLASPPDVREGARAPIEDLVE